MCFGTVCVKHTFSAGCLVLHVVSQMVVHISIFVKTAKHLININDALAIRFTVK